MKKTISILLILTMVIGLAGCGNQGVQDVEQPIIDSSVEDANTELNSGVESNEVEHYEPMLIGTIVEYEGGHALIESEDGMFSVYLDSINLSEGVSNDFKVGNYIRIRHQGDVMESDPMQINPISIEENSSTSEVVVDGDMQNDTISEQMILKGRLSNAGGPFGYVLELDEPILVGEEEYAFVEILMEDDNVLNYVPKSYLVPSIESPNGFVYDDNNPLRFEITMNNFEWDDEFHSMSGYVVDFIGIEGNDNLTSYVDSEFEDYQKVDYILTTSRIMLESGFPHKEKIEDTDFYHSIPLLAEYVEYFKGMDKLIEYNEDAKAYIVVDKPSDYVEGSSDLVKVETLKVGDKFEGWTFKELELTKNDIYYKLSGKTKISGELFYDDYMGGLYVVLDDNVKLPKQRFKFSTWEFDMIQSISLSEDLVDKSTLKLMQEKAYSNDYENGIKFEADMVGFMLAGALESEYWTEGTVENFKILNDKKSENNDSGSMFKNESYRGEEINYNDYSVVAIPYYDGVNKDKLVEESVWTLKEYTHSVDVAIIGELKNVEIINSVTMDKTLDAVSLGTVKDTNLTIYCDLSTDMSGILVKGIVNNTEEVLVEVHIDNMRDEEAHPITKIN